VTAGTSGGTAQDHGRQQLETLRIFWGQHYEFGSPGEHDWQARRRDRTGEVMRADTPDALQSKVAADFYPPGPVPLPGPCAPRIFA
jgi:hypothetical protein